MHRPVRPHQSSEMIFHGYTVLMTEKKALLYTASGSLVVFSLFNLSPGLGFHYPHVYMFVVLVLLVSVAALLWIKRKPSSFVALKTLGTVGVITLGIWAAHLFFGITLAPEEEPALNYYFELFFNFALVATILLVIKELVLYFFLFVRKRMPASKFTL